MNEQKISENNELRIVGRRSQFAEEYPSAQILSDGRIVGRDVASLEEAMTDEQRLKNEQIIQKFEELNSKALKNIRQEQQEDLSPERSSDQ